MQSLDSPPYIPASSFNCGLRRHAPPGGLFRRVTFHTDAKHVSFITAKYWRQCSLPLINLTDFDLKCRPLSKLDSWMEPLPWGWGKKLTVLERGGGGPSVSLGDASAGESADDEWIYRLSVETRPGTFWARVPHAGEIKPPLSNQGIRWLKGAIPYWFPVGGTRRHVLFIAVLQISGARREERAITNANSQ